MKNKPVKSLREQTEELLEFCKIYSDCDCQKLLEYSGKAEVYARRARFKLGHATALKYGGLARYLIGDCEQGISKLSAAYECYRQLNHQSGLIETLCIFSTIYGMSGEFDRAKGALLEAGRYVDNVISGRDLAYFYGAWSLFYKGCGNVEKHIEFAKRQLAASQIIEHEKGVAHALAHLGKFSLTIGELEIGFRTCSTVIKICQKLELRETEAQVLHNLAHSCLLAKEFDQALTLSEKAEAIAEEFGGLVGRVIAQSLTVKVLVEREEYEVALCKAKDLTQLISDSVPGIVSVAALRLRAESHQFCSEIEKALHWYNQALDLAVQSSLQHDRMMILEALAALYEKQGDFESAYSHYREFIRIQEEGLRFLKKERASWLSRESAFEHEEKASNIEAEYRVGWLDGRQLDSVVLSVGRGKSDNRLASIQRDLQAILLTPDGQSTQKDDSFFIRLDQNSHSTQTQGQVHGQSQRAISRFAKTLTSRCLQLTPTELKICSLLRDNLSTKDIAALLSVEPTTVDFHRWAIRKKLALPRGANLTAFLVAM